MTLWVNDTDDTIHLNINNHYFSPHNYFSIPGYFWHVSDFHLDPRYGRNISDDKDIFLGSYNEVSGGVGLVAVVTYIIQSCWTEQRNKFGSHSCDSPYLLVKVSRFRF